MDEKQEFIIIQQRPGSPSKRTAKESTLFPGMLTPFAIEGHAASEQLTIMPTDASMPIICGSDPTFPVALLHYITVNADKKIRIRSR